VQFVPSEHGKNPGFLIHIFERVCRKTALSTGSPSLIGIKRF